MPERYTTQEQIDEMRREIWAEKEKKAGIHTGHTGIHPGPKGRGKRNVRKVAVRAAGWILFVSVALVLVVTIVSVNMAKSRGEIPSLLGYQFFVVESGSMEPTLNIGSVIVARKPRETQKRLKEKTIVTFKTTSGAVVTHRIVQVITEKGRVSYRTKGDNPRNSVDQETLTPERILGVFVAKIPLT